MRTARESAVRLLQLMMIASVVLPAALFAYASWVSYRDISSVADERILRSIDVMQEQSLKVFETVDRTFAEVNEIVRGMSDDEIHAAEPRLHQRLASIVATMPQLHAILLVGRDGRPLWRARLPPCLTESTSAIAIISRPSSTATPGPMSAICARRGCPASPAISSICRVAWNRRTAPSTA
jgi:hypothetical protein